MYIVSHQNTYYVCVFLQKVFLRQLCSSRAVQDGERGGDVVVVVTRNHKKIRIS